MNLSYLMIQTIPDYVPLTLVAIALIAVIIDIILQLKEFIRDKKVKEKNRQLQLKKQAKFIQQCIDNKTPLTMVSWERNHYFIPDSFSDVNFVSGNEYNNGFQRRNSFDKDCVWGMTHATIIEERKSFKQPETVKKKLYEVNIVFKHNTSDPKAEHKDNKTIYVLSYDVQDAIKVAYSFTDGFIIGLTAEEVSTFVEV